MRREYFYRLGAVSFLVLTVLVVAHGIFLFPSYQYLSQEISTKQRQIDILDKNLTASGEKEVHAKLEALKKDATYLARLGSIPTASAAIKAVLALPRPGIQLTGITYTPAGSRTAANGKMALSGNASTREALRAYDLALASVSWISNVDLPISSYAKESNIPFVITLTGSLAP